MPKLPMTAHKTTLAGQDDGAFDREFWETISPIERLMEVWKMTEEVWRLKGWDPGESGLSRSTSRVVRS